MLQEIIRYEKMERRKQSGTYDKDGTSLEVDIVRERMLSLYSVSGLIQFKFITSLDGLGGKIGLLTLKQGSKTGELGQGSERDIYRCHVNSKHNGVRMQLIPRKREEF